MKIKTGRVDILIIVIIIIALLAVGLGFLQFKWINNFSRSSELRLKASINNSTLQALNSARIETSILYSVVYVSIKELDTSDFSRFNGDLDLWKERTSFSSLLENIYLFLPDTETDNYTLKEWNNTKEDFLPAENPLPFSGLLTKMSTADNVSVKNSLKEFEKEMQKTGMYMINPIVPAETYEEEFYGKIPPFLITEINPSCLYGQVLPDFLDKFLNNYPFRIITKSPDNNPSETLIRSGSILLDQSPELTIPITGSLFMPLKEQFDNRETKEISMDLFLNLWLSVSGRILQTSEEDPESEYLLEVYYPGAELSSFINKTRIVNLIVSTGFEVLFVAVLIILYYLYRTNKNMRIREHDFISSMSHELRTPIAVVKSTSDTLGKGIVRDPARIKQYTDVISEQAVRLSESVEGILQFSGFLDGIEYPETYSDFNLSDTASVTADSMELLINDRGGRLIRQIEPGIISGINPEAFRIILENLLSNAIKHGLSHEESEKPGEIHLELFSEEESNIVLRVSDKGQGISILERKKLFQPFFRGKDTRANQTPGNGLGLNLVKRTVDILGGSIDVKSPWFNEEEANRKGCCFKVTFPAKRRSIDG